MNTLLAGLAAGLVLAGCSGGGATTSGSSSSCTTSTTSTTACTAASDLVVTLSKTSMTDSGTDTVTVTVTAVDASRNAVSGATVTIVPDNNAIITASGTTTAADGTLTGALSIGSDKSDRTIDLIVKSGSITKTATVAVTGAKLQATTGSATPGTTSTVAYTLTDVNNVAITNSPISVTFNGTTSSAMTDGSGAYTFSYTVPSAPTLEIVATAAGTSATSDITTNTVSTVAATGTVTAASVSANPSTVSVNAAGSTANQVVVRGLFLGAGNAPIQYARVRFDLAGDVNGIGGTLNSGSGYVYTDSNGVAQTLYTPGTRASGNLGLTVRACWSEADFAAGTCPNAATTTITVAQGGVSLSIFHNGTVTVDDTKDLYELTFTVQVVDASGAPIQGALVTPSVDLPRFYRGGYNIVGSAWALTRVNACDNEDVNRNNVLETYSNGEAEDANGTGKLEPYSADVAIATVSTGSDTTDQFGLAYFRMQYGENIATWDDFTLTFSSTVSGTEGRAAYSANLPYPASALTTTTSAPPFVVSPYNFAPVTALSVTPVNTVIVTDPTTGKSGSLCQAQP